MKKLIVFSVIFALVAGSVFAADIGVTVLGAAQLLNGNDKQELKETKDDGTPVYGNKNQNDTDFGIGRINIEASGALEDGTIGGWLRFRAGGGQGSNVEGWGKVWWKPIDAFQLQLGANPDGEWGLDGVAGWNFYQLACDVSIIDNGNTWGWGYTGLGDVKFRDAFFGGWGEPNALIFNVTPVEALEIHLAFPIGQASVPAYKEYQKFTVQAKYNIDGVGTAAITYQNGFGHEDGTRGGGTAIYSGETNDPSKLFIYFGLSSIENLGVDIGVGLTLPSDVTHTVTYYGAEGTPDENKKLSETTITKNYPLNVGVGVNFSSGAFGVKARVLAEFLGSTETDKARYNLDGSKVTTGNATENYKLGDGLTMLIDVQPSFAVNETMTAYLSMGVGFKTGWDERDMVLNSDGTPKVESGNVVYEITADPRSEFAWHVQPYVVITPSYWSGAFFAGFRLESPIGRDNLPGKDGKENMTRIVNWSIPIGISFSF